MTTQDPEIGQVTKADLREALRVNRALEITAQGDITFREQRVAACEERIRDQQILIREWNTIAESAPERLVKIRAKITRQEEQLKNWVEERTAAGAPSLRASREALIQALSLRIAKGGEDGARAIQEMVKLAKG